MVNRQAWSLASALVTILAVLVPQSYAGAPVICSNQNTGSNYASVYNQWQTDGSCTSECRPGGYAIAIVQAYYCWCANDAPANQLDINSCNDTCPGYGDPHCGNTLHGLFSYFLIDGKAPSGTVSEDSTPSTTSSVSTFPSSSGTPSSERPTSIGDSSSLTVSAMQQSPSSSSSSVGSTTSESSTTPAPVSTIVTTVTGQVKTIIVTPTGSSDSSLGASSPKSSGNGVSTGAIVGIVLGVALGIGAVIGLTIWFWLKRRHQMQMEEGSITGSSARGGNGIPSRQVSQLSSAGLLTKIPRIRTDGLPTSNGPKSAESAQLDRRSLGTDQRLNPYAIYAHEESRLSNVSLQDNQDYSRQLRVANPDL